MKRYFILLMLTSTALCLADDRGNVQNNIAVIKKILNEIYDDVLNQISSPLSVKTNTKLHELYQLAEQIGLRDNTISEQPCTLRACGDPVELCRFYAIELKHNPRFQVQQNIQKNEAEGELNWVIHNGAMGLVRGQEGERDTSHMSMIEWRAHYEAEMNNMLATQQPCGWLADDDPFKGTKFDW